MTSQYKITVRSLLTGSDDTEVLIFFPIFACQSKLALKVVSGKLKKIKIKNNRSTSYRFEEFKPVFWISHLVCTELKNLNSIVPSYVHACTFQF